MSLVSPARVGHAVTHSSSAGAFTGAAVGAAVGLVIVIVGWEVVATATVVEVGMAVAGGAATVANAADWGKSIAKFCGLNKLFDASVAGHLVTGFATVKLGPEIQNAARADPDTSADCAGDHVGWEGADHVFLGNKPMSRVGDRLKCQGKIMEGEPTIYVGGNPSQEGKDLPEADSNAEKILDKILAIMGLGSSKTKAELAWGVAGIVADEAGGAVKGAYKAADYAKKVDDFTGISKYGWKSTAAGAAMYGHVLFH